MNSFRSRANSVVNAFKIKYNRFKILCSSVNVSKKNAFSYRAASNLVDPFSNSYVVHCYLRWSGSLFEVLVEEWNRIAFQKWTFLSENIEQKNLMNFSKQIIKIYFHTKRRRANCSSTTVISLVWMSSNYDWPWPFLCSVLYLLSMCIGPFLWWSGRWKINSFRLVWGYVKENIKFHFLTSRRFQSGNSKLNSWTLFIYRSSWLS